MALTQKMFNVFRCDLRKPDGSPDCDVEFEYNANPQPPETWPAGVHIRLMNIVQVSHPMTAGGQPPNQMPNPPRLYCSREHAVKALELDQHLPALPPKIVAATTNAEVKAAAAGANAVAEMKGPGVARHVRPS